MGEKEKMTLEQFLKYMAEGKYVVVDFSHGGKEVKDLHEVMGQEIYSIYPSEDETKVIIEILGGVMSEKTTTQRKNKTCGLKMEAPFSKLTGFFICYVDEKTGEMRKTATARLKDAFALFDRLQKTTDVNVWAVYNGEITSLALSNCFNGVE
jgi:hypothetical protein